MRAWESFTNQKQWREYLRDLIKTNNKALVRAIVLVYDLQTEREKVAGESIEDNMVGFNKIDAKDLGAIAIKIKAGKTLTEGEIARSRNKMVKYWKQLMWISKRKMQEA